MKITGICFTRSGKELAEKMHRFFQAENASGDNNRFIEDTWFCKGKVFQDNVPEGFTFAKDACADWAGQHFSNSDALVFIGATGICVRAIAPYVKDKKTDPAVICFDEKGTFGISLLSGHIGGANALTEKLCKALGSIPVVTTATDVNRKFAVDVYATEQNMAISSMLLAKDVSAAIVAGETIPVTVEEGINIIPDKTPGNGTLWLDSVSEESQSVKNIESDHKDCDALLTAQEDSGNSRKYQKLGIHISPFYKDAPYENTLYLIPRCLTIGIGCRRDTPVEKIEALVDKTLAEYKIHTQALKAVATIDLKKDEQGLLEFCRRRNLPFTVYSAEELKAVEGAFTPSAFVSGITGVDNVCERSAVLHGGGTLIIRKTKGDGVTCAVTL